MTKKGAAIAALTDLDRDSDEPIDAEIAAIAIIVDAFGPLSPDERTRVLTYLERPLLRPHQQFHRPVDVQPTTPRRKRSG